ncbi:MAG: Nucleic acid binding OB-fold tRNA/helicase-type [Candidatus Parvarchaeum acidophilus ARMAN-5_'5-way FS']|jgi:hypothetical protein|uniref:Nucleic acid binding OB-fold tRNA/helicase-type n=1 Tax=Candidatus Parvarchaeum acidophilus ARMAN-5_'5-way FS' TaxID=994838 RepID=F2UU60_PARA5|nr:MAG: Nucleic acid binding OB-fold tRNA/helicase-type [Candidatus Parvarchaeum acidophilus ARMAN-5_'5-way FS']
MENQIIEDTSITEIKEDNSRIRIVGKVISFDDKTGIFELEDGDSRITCMSNLVSLSIKPLDLVLVTGRAISADSAFEIRADSVQSININDYTNYNKYLKIRRELTSNGS